MEGDKKKVIEISKILKQIGLLGAASYKLIKKKRLKNMKNNKNSKECSALLVELKNEIERMKELEYHISTDPKIKESYVEIVALYNFFKSENEGN